MKFPSVVTSLFISFLSLPIYAMDKGKAQQLVNDLAPGGIATEIRKLSRDNQPVYEIEYLLNDQEYELIVTPDGKVVDHYKDQGGRGGLPVIVSLAVSQEENIYKDQSQDAEVIPVIVGNYGNFWFKGLRHGYYLYAGDAFAFSPMIKINPDYGYEVDKADNDSLLYQGLDDTDVTVEAGVQLFFDLNYVDLELNLLADITGGHKGGLAELSLSKPQHLGSLLVIPSLTFTYNDSKVTNYYFGVKNSQATAFRPAFDTGSSLDTELSTIFIWNFSGSWYLIGDLTYKFFDDKLEQSPLVESVEQASGFIGIGYSF